MKNLFEKPNRFSGKRIVESGGVHRQSRDASYAMHHRSSIALKRPARRIFSSTRDS